MIQEIERKFVAKKEETMQALMGIPHTSYEIWQMYITDNVRIRIKTHSDGSECAYFTSKKVTDLMIDRQESEVEINIADAIAMKELLFETENYKGVIRKTRHVFPNDDNTKWEIDFFHGDNEGLIIAEIELPSRDYKLNLNLIPFLGQEVSNNIKYYNCELAKKPFREWERYSD